MAKKLLTKGHQGDVSYTRIEALPDGCKKEDNKVLAYGEVTGHSHRFTEDHVEVFVSNDNRRFVVISKKPATLLHEEHSPHRIAPGVYEIKIAREWTDNDEPRQVID